MELLISARQVKDLAEFTGLLVSESTSDILDAQYTITSGHSPAAPEEGAEAFNGLVAYSTDYPDEGLFPLVDAFQIENEEDKDFGLKTCTLIAEMLGVEDKGIYQAVFDLKNKMDALLLETSAHSVAAGEVYAAGYRHGHLNTADGIAFQNEVEQSFQERGAEAFSESVEAILERPSQSLEEGA